MIFFDYLQHHIIDIFSPVVELEFAFFEVQVRRGVRDSMELHQSSLCKGPKGLDVVDMVFTPNTLIAAVMHSVILFIPQIHTTIITAPLIRVNNIVRGYAVSNNGLELVLVQFGTTSV